MSDWSEPSLSLSATFRRSSGVGGVGVAGLRDGLLEAPHRLLALAYHRTLELHKRLLELLVYVQQVLHLFVVARDHAEVRDLWVGGEHVVRQGVDALDAS